MNKNTRVCHATSGFRMTFGDVEDGIACCALTWVTFGQTFRHLTEAEAIDARNRRAQVSEPFPVAELEGIVTLGIDGMRRERNMAWQGTLFAVPQLAEAMARNGGAVSLSVVSCQGDISMTEEGRPRE